MCAGKKENRESITNASGNRPIQQDRNCNVFGEENSQRDNVQDQHARLQIQAKAGMQRCFVNYFLEGIMCQKSKILKKEQICVQPSDPSRRPPWKTSMLSAATIAVFLRDDTHRPATECAAPCASEPLFRTPRTR